MSVFFGNPEFVGKPEEEPPLGAAAAAVGKISRLLLLVICAGPIAVFPIGLAYKAYVHYFGTASPPAIMETIEQPELPA